jgi:hypothetical protein
MRRGITVSEITDDAVQITPKNGDGKSSYQQAPADFLGVSAIFHIVENGGDLFTLLARK